MVTSKVIIICCLSSYQDCDDDSNDRHLEGLFLTQNDLGFLKFSKTIHFMWHSKGNRVTLQYLVAVATRAEILPPRGL